MTPEELVHAACPLIAEMGWAFYFVPDTAAKAEKLGIDVFAFYAVGRGGVLGDGEARVVHSAFGYFNPELVATMWDTGRQAIAPRDGARAYTECCRDFGRATFSAVDGLDAYCRAAESVVAAADAQGLTLFAGASSEPLADDLSARAMQLTTILREFRGSTHLVAVRASGLSPKKAHQIARPEMWEIFGWQESDKEDVTDADRQAMKDAEALTDRLVLPAYSAVDESLREPMITALGAMKEAVAAA